MAVSSLPVGAPTTGPAGDLQRDARMQCFAEWKRGPRSVSLWHAMAYGMNQESALLTCCTKGGEEAPYIGTDESGGLYALATSGISMSVPTPAPSNQWRHIGYRTDGVDHHLYVDGAEVAYLRVPSPVTEAFDRIVLFNSTARAQYSGALRSVKLFERMLTEAEMIAEGRALGTVPAPAGLFAFWKLADVTDLLDYSGNQHDLSIPGTPFFCNVPDPTLTVVQALALQPSKVVFGPDAPPLL